MDLAFIKGHKKPVIIAGVVIVLLGILMFIRYEHNQISHLLPGHTYKITVVGPNRYDETKTQTGVLIFKKDTYKKGDELGEDFSDLSSLVDEARDGESSPFTVKKDSVTLSGGYSTDLPVDGNATHLKNLTVSNGGKIIKGDISYKFTNESATEDDQSPWADYDDVQDETGTGTVKLELIK